MKNRKFIWLLAALLVVAGFFMMSLPFFIGFCLLVVVFLAFKDFRVEEVQGGDFTQKIIHHLTITVVGVMALATLHSYWAAPERIFKNADHHVLSHLGYQFGQRLSLANDRDPQRALWDSKKGVLQVVYSPVERIFSLESERFYEPLFLRNDDRYTLSNGPIIQTVDSSFSIGFVGGRQLTLRFQHLNEEQPKYQYQYSNRDTTFAPVAINFKKRIRTGLSLRDLVSRSPLATAEFEQVLALLDSSYLLRQQYLIEDNDKKNNSPLCLFPARLWADSVETLSIDGQAILFDERLTLRLPLQENQRFYVGLRTKQTRTYQLKGDGQNAYFYFGFPERKYLKSSVDEDQESLFITSSSAKVAESNLTSALLFDGPQQPENYNHFAANMSYHTGPTTQKMLFRVVNEVQENDLSQATTAKVVAAGDTMYMASSGVALNSAHDVRWIMRVTDLKATNGMPWWAAMLFVVGYTVLVLISIRLTPKRLINNSFKVELAVYVVLLAFLVVRTVILWRAVTFLPAEDATGIDYEILGGLSAYFWYQVAFTCVFFMLLIGYKFWVFQLNRKLPKWAWFERFLSSPWVYACFLLYGGVALKEIGDLERLASVLVPVGTYFFIDFVFQRRAVILYTNAVLSPEYRFVKKLNWLSALAAFALGDAGFSLIFIVFSLCYLLLQSWVFPKNGWKAPQNKLLAAAWSYRSFGITLLLSAFIWISPQVVSVLFRHILIAVEVFLMVLIVFIWRETYLSRLVRWASIGVIATIMVLAIPFQEKIYEVAQSKNRILYRAEVRFRTADEIIASEKFNLGNDRRLLNAAENQWIINYFYGKGSFNPWCYFNRVPHFQQGSSYLTQISDLVLVRYVIAEHSEWVLVGLILLLGGLLFLALRNGMLYNSQTKLRVQLICFLFSLALTIWLTATDRMLFVGQDFPLLSMNSILTLFVSFVLFLMVVLSGYGKSLPNEEVLIFKAKGAKRFNWWAIQLVLGIVVWSYILFHKNEDKFNLSETISKLEKTFDGLNTILDRYQQENLRQASNATAFIQGFDGYMKREANGFFTGKTFEQSVYDAFKDRYVQSNSPEQLLHLKINEEGRYEFAVNNYFYNVNSPDVFQNTWRGHLTSSSVYKALMFNSLTQQNRAASLDTTAALSNLKALMEQRRLLDSDDNLNIRLSLVPAGWAKDSLPIVIVGRTVGEERQTRSSFLVKNGTGLLASNQSKHAIVLKPNDILHFQPKVNRRGRANIVSLKLTQKEEGYLAKNIWLNGKPQHFYPLQERSMWSYHFTNLVKSSYSENPDMLQQNVELTLDPELMKQIYGRVAMYFSEGDANEKRGFSLVVMDNEGSVKALSDYKTDHRTHLDPNQMGRYKALFEDLYMGVSPLKERQLLGNRCLMRMPNGPASTFKPILYGAITSQYDLGWPNLSFGGLGNYPSLSAGGDYLIKHFGGRRMRLIVGANNVGQHDNIYYLSRSTNTYNSMMVYLGSLTTAQIEGVARGLQSGRSSGYLQVGAHPTDPNFNFPLLNYNGRTFRIDQMPAWDQRSSLLSQGLSDNFNFPMSQMAEQDTASIGNRSLARGLEGNTTNGSKNTFKLWCFPEASHLYLIDRTVDTQNAIPQLAMGAYPITTTPLKMAEMAVNLFSFNPSIRANVLATRTKTSAGQFSVGANWGNVSNLANFYANNLFLGMNEAIVNPSGTARFVGSTANGYTLYAKTGTISSGRNEGESRDKNLMLVISQHPIHGRNLSMEELQANKFYVLYFSFYNDASEGGWSASAQQTVRDLIGLVQQSAGFRQLMRE